MEVFDELKNRIDETGARVVELGTNVIEGCSQKELDHLKKVLTVNEQDPVFYLILPSHDFKKKYNFLYNKPLFLRFFLKSVLILESIFPSLTIAIDTS